MSSSDLCYYSSISNAYNGDPDTSMVTLESQDDFPIIVSPGIDPSNGLHRRSDPLVRVAAERDKNNPPDRSTEPNVFLKMETAANTQNWSSETPQP